MWLNRKIPVGGLDVEPAPHAPDFICHTLLVVAAGMDDYVSKPSRIEELVGALSKTRPLETGQGGPGMEETIPEPSGGRLDEGGGEEISPSPAGAPVSVAAVLDAAALKNLLSVVGGEFSFLGELIDSFLEDAPQLLAELKQLVEDGDAAGVRRVAHSLKSNGADFGATTFSDLCKELEMVGKSGDLEGAADLAARIAGNTGEDG